MEHVVTPEHTGVLGIEAEHQPHTELVQTLERFGVFLIVVLLQERIIEKSDDFTGLDGDLHLATDMLAAGIRQEGQTVILLFQIGKQDLFRFAAGLLHVVDMKLREVARHHPARVPRERQLRDIALGLLKRR